jgi:DivIVA domain-containing protein
MDISPQTVRTTSFKLVKKGYDPDEVDSFKEQVAAAVEHAQNQATAMEARARAAVAKLQEVSQQVGSGAPAPAAAPAHSGDTEVISRTLLLAQRTADATVAEARVEADQIVNKARDEAGRVLDTARNMAAKTVDDARFDARRAAEDERVKADNEVQSLLARRDFLLADVDHLEQYLGAQRERLRDAAVQLHELIERVPGGLGDMRRPLLSASAEPLPPELAPSPAETDTPSPKLNLDSLPAPRFADDAAGAPTSMVDPVPAPPTSPEDASERVWRMLDEEVASGRGSGNDVTGELTIPTDRTPFRFDDEELQ